MAGSKTGDQLQELTVGRQDKRWTEYTGWMDMEEGWTWDMGWMDMEETREGETRPKRDQDDQDDSEESRERENKIKQEQEDQGERGDTEEQERKDYKEEKEERNDKKEGNAGNSNQATKSENGCIKPVITNGVRQTGGRAGDGSEGFSTGKLIFFGSGLVYSHHSHG